MTFEMINTHTQRKAQKNEESQKSIGQYEKI